MITPSQAPDSIPKKTPPTALEKHTRSDNWLESRATVLIPGIGSVFLMSLFAVFQTLFIGCTVTVIGCKPFEASQLFPLSPPASISDSGPTDGRSVPEEPWIDSKVTIERYTGRLLWIFLSGIGFIATLIALATAPIIIYRALNGVTRRSAITCALMLICALGGFALWRHPKLHMSILGDAMQATIAVGRGGIPTIVGIMNVFSSLSYVASFALTFGASAILLPQKPGADAISRLDHIASCMEDLRLVLYVGTAQLITAVLRISSASDWMVSFLSPAVADVERTFNTVRVSVNGGFFTLLMIAAYVPTAAILNARAHQALPPGLSSADRKAELQERGLTVSAKETLPRLAVLLGPLLTGPVGELLKALGK
jgi:hypothetical protein